ncbi:MAG: hypothetical protein K2Y51_11540 [Gammaproteobacteria bacterium]|nr:hypothetical protein [Gammaproteobacteria bacterium]
MAHDTPDLAEILRTVHEFIRDLKPRLGGMDGYQALCAQMLLEIALRELPEWQPQETADDARLRALCEVGPEAPRETLAARLAARIAAGEFDARMDELADELLRHVIAKVRVSRPKHLEPEHRAD